ncbi:cell surface glycoprotein CD200 receptor 1-like isoform X2 [Castor canadensis]|uniref:Cell surface glycoprotein CD200 receptor 1-like isoform X2 n=3 Tax=Castor canadensis TaxID=51338 RepID=A0AC58MIK5_CASCN
MVCPWKTWDLVILLMLTVFIEADSNSSCADERQMAQDNSSPLAEVNKSLSVQIGEKAVLCCPVLPPTSKLVMITWEVILRGKLLCRLSYKPDTKETATPSCTNGRITWASRPDRNPHLQIDAVAVTHDGLYSCDIVTADGNYRLGYNLQVLVPPEVTLTRGKNRTVVCEAVAGKPAARISWTPQGHCTTEKEWSDNDTVTVRSTWHCPDSNASAVTCLVSHLTGNRSLSLQLSSDSKESKQYTRFIIPPIILIIVGCIWLLKINGFRKCKLRKSDAVPVIEEDEMQPYASYTEKSNPLYDTASKAKTP